jgi:ATP-dependent Clp protease ATP-binding subunit ClpC
MKLAMAEAEKLGHTYVGTEHMLLGMADEGEGLAAHVLREFDFDIVKARQAIVDALKQGQQGSNTVVSKIKAAMLQGEVLAQGRQVALTKRAKKVIELALVEAKRMDHRSIGTEHLLLGILLEGDGLAVGVLETLGIDPAQVRAKILDELTAPSE